MIEWVGILHVAAFARDRVVILVDSSVPPPLAHEQSMPLCNQSRARAGNVSAAKHKGDAHPSSMGSLSFCWAAFNSVTSAPVSIRR